MRLLVFSIILISTQVFAKFTFNECINSSFNEEIKHKGQFFGLIKHELKVKKDNCIIDINFEKITNKNWVVDICREPIHIKKKGSGIDIFKRQSACELDPKQSYCYEEKELFSVIQDDGLIFAEGERDSIQTQHGKIYCSFLLLKHYLKRGLVLSRNNEINLYEGIVDSQKNCDTTKPQMPAEITKAIIPVEKPEIEKQEVEKTEATDGSVTPVGEF